MTDSEPDAVHDAPPLAETVTTAPTSPTDAAAPALPEVFPPTLREVMVRPRWLAMLALCLLVAGVFAWLGQWQLGRALATSPVPPGATEQVQPIADVVAPGAYLDAARVGQRVSVTGTWVPGDFLIVSSRLNNGDEGYWVTGQLRVSGAAQPTSVAVALGWAATQDDARAAAAQLDAAASAGSSPVEVTGRLISDEGPKAPKAGSDPDAMPWMSPAALLSRWHDTAELNVYRPYLASATAPASLVDIASPAPSDGSNVNWLNIFYAIEWAVFAGFAFYLWYRLARDAWEREVEEMEEAATSAASP